MPEPADQQQPRGRRLTTLLEQRLPEPPTGMRQGPFAEDAFPAPARSERTTSLLGVALAVTFGVCFFTGLISHFIQQPAGWFPLTWPSHPAGLYRVTQGLHVITGIASIPLLLGKLWSVYPKFFTWPPTRDLAHALSRLGLLVLVGSAIFQLLSGLINLARWYTPMKFFFTDAHYWTAWIAIGALMVHVGSQIHILRRSLGKEAKEREEHHEAEARRAMGPADGDGERDSEGDRDDDGVRAISRRGLLTAVGAGMGVVTIATAGQTIGWLSPLSLLSPRDPRAGSQGVPVNKSAVGAGVTETALAADYALAVEGGTPVLLTRDDLAAMPQTTVDLPIACVEGWSAMATWTGVRVGDVLRKAGLDEGSAGDVGFESIQTGGRYRASEMPISTAFDPDALLALQLNGEDLDLDHGYPVRLIAPNRPGVLQTKWVNKISIRGGAA